MSSCFLCYSNLAHLNSWISSSARNWWFKLIWMDRKSLPLSYCTLYPGKCYLVVQGAGDHRKPPLSSCSLFFLWFSWGLKVWKYILKFQGKLPCVIPCQAEFPEQKEMVVVHRAHCPQHHSDGIWGPGEQPYLASWEGRRQAKRGSNSGIGMLSCPRQALLFCWKNCLDQSFTATVAIPACTKLWVIREFSP